MSKQCYGAHVWRDTFDPKPVLIGIGERQIRCTDLEAREIHEQLGDLLRNVKKEKENGH